MLDRVLLTVTKARSSSYRLNRITRTVGLLGWPVSHISYSVLIGQMLLLRPELVGCQASSSVVTGLG